MAEYIEREAVHEILERYQTAPHIKQKTHFSKGMLTAIRSCIVLVDIVPAADAVPVVRCKDCIHGELDDPELVFAYYCKHDRCSWHKADHFCAYGERRDTDD